MNPTFFSLLVEPNGSWPMRVSIHAESIELAQHYASNRWPGAAISCPRSKPDDQPAAPTPLA